MRSFLFLSLVMRACSAEQCGTGSVDLSGVAPFTIAINCPVNKDADNNDIGCVTQAQKGPSGVLQTQISNIFSVDACGVLPLPQDCPDSLKDSGSAGIEVTKDVDSNDPSKPIVTCYSLGSSSSRTFELLDEENPDEGVRARYTGGTPCGDTTRSLEVKFRCSAQGNEDNQNVVEPTDDICHYIVEHNTINACPSYCVTGNNLCSGNGICGHYDQPCLCYKGFTGKHCEIPGEPNDGSQGWTAAAVCLTIAILLLAALLAFVLYMYIKLRRLAPVDTEAYATLSNKFNELGQIT